LITPSAMGTQLSIFMLYSEDFVGLSSAR